MILLEQAVERVPDTNPEFFWPKHNLDWVKTLIEAHEGGDHSRPT